MGNENFENATTSIAINDAEEQALKQNRTVTLERRVPGPSIRVGKDVIIVGRERTAAEVIDVDSVNNKITVKVIE